MDIFKIKSMIRALNHRNYRLFFFGQSISLIGTWMQRTALVWLVYRLTDSVALLGIVDFVGHIPTFFITPFAGVLLDRWNRYRIVVIAQTLSMIQAFLLAFLVITNQITVAHIMLLSIMLGFINSFDIPARQSFVIDVVDDRKDLVNAIALNSAIFNSARILGPSIAGTAIAILGEGLCFLFNGLSYLAVLLALANMKLQRKPTKMKETNVFRELKEGLSYAYNFKPIKSILSLLATSSFMGMPIMVLLPVYAKTILLGGPQTLGLLTSTFGAGALLGTVYLASRTNIIGLEKLLASASALFGIGIIVFSQSTHLILSIPMIFLTGFGMVAQTASTNTLLQSMVDEDKRGRVMSLYVVLFGGLVPFGSLSAGYIASFIGTPVTLLIGGIMCIVGAVCFTTHLPSWRNAVTEVYQQKGFLSSSSK